MVITFNYKGWTDTITFDSLKTALEKETAGSDFDYSTTPSPENIAFSGLFLCLRREFCTLELAFKKRI